MASVYAEHVTRSLAEFRSRIGASEKPPGSNRTEYGKEYGWDGVYYCVQACWCVVAPWGGSTAGMLKSASTGAVWTWGKSVGRTRTTPQPGDLVIVTKNGATRHMDMVESYRNGQLICIGANTSNGYGSTDNGGGTYRNNRSGWLAKGLGSKNGWAIRGFVRPFYGVTTEHVKAVQRAAGIKVDGKIGPDTVTGTRAVQTSLGVTADGFPGPSTMAALRGTDPATPPANAATPSTPAGGEFADVDRTQAWLTELGYGPLTSGTYDKATAAAVLAAQKDLGITPADGRPGPATRTHLEAAVATLDDIQKTLTTIQRSLEPGIEGKRTDGEFARFIRGQRDVLRKDVAAVARTLEPGIAGKRTDGEAIKTLRLFRNDVRSDVAALRGEIAGLEKALQASASGGAVNLDEVRAAARDGVASAMTDLKADVTLVVSSDKS